MKELRSHFVFNRSQRNGIFLLAGIILVLQAGYFFIAFSSEEEVVQQESEEIVRFQQQVDSLKKAASIRDSAAILPFNPNYISDFKGYTLGMSVEEIDRLRAYRAADKWMNSSEEFQQVTGVSDSLLKKISPYFKFPDRVRNVRGSVPAAVRSSGTVVDKQDLNLATAEELRQVSGVGETLSQRIVRYRAGIGGFRSGIQLKDVYGLSEEVIGRIRERFEVTETGNFERADLNSIEVIPLSELPYFNYELAREVVNFRKLRGEINGFGDLEHIKGFPAEKIDRIQLYLTIN